MAEGQRLALSWMLDLCRVLPHLGHCSYFGFVLLASWNDYLHLRRELIEDSLA